MLGMLMVNMIVMVCYGRSTHCGCFREGEQVWVAADAAACTTAKDSCLTVSQRGYQWVMTLTVELDYEGGRAIWQVSDELHT
jgi:hypothetical protein